MNKHPVILCIAFACTLLARPSLAGGRCTGAANCTACTNCSRCRHCAQEGGTCGVKEGLAGAGALAGNGKFLGAPKRAKRPRVRTSLPPVEADGDEDAPRGTPNAVVSAGTIRPGVERWTIKITTDREAKDIRPAPQVATVEQLCARVRPADMPLTGKAAKYEHHRASPMETTTFVVTATLTAYKAEPDGDFHLVLTGKTGQTMIVEVPSPLFVPQSNARWKQIAAVRSAFQTRFRPLARLKHCAAVVTVTGVGFFDFSHRQTGVAPNAIELHPVLAIAYK